VQTAPPPAGDRGDLSALAAVIGRRLWLVVLGAGIGIVAALVFAHVQPKRYTSTASLLFRPVYLDVAVTGSTLQVPGSDPTRDVATDVSLVSQHDVLAAAARRLNRLRLELRRGGLVRDLPPLYTVSSLNKDVSIGSSGKTDIVSVSATAAAPGEAARAANAVADAYIAEAGQLIVSEIHRVQNGIRRQLRNARLTQTQRTALTQAQTKLGVLALIGPDNVHLAQTAIPPTKQSSPRPVLDLVIGGIGGLLVGFALAFGTEQLDPRLRRPDELERETGLPVLAAIPRRRSIGRPGLDRDRPYHGLDGNEPFERLATVLRYLPTGRKIRTVLLISPDGGSGKTSIALRLALAAAGGLSANALLVEADLRRRSLSRLIGLSPEVGLSTVLLGTYDLEVQALPLGEEAFVAAGGRRSIPILTRGQYTSAGLTQSIAVEERLADYVAPSARDLALLLAGPASQDAAALLGSETMRDLVQLWAATYDFTVIDGPGAEHVADMIPLATQVDAVVIVARLGKDTAQGVRRLQTELERLDVRPVGVVANFARRARNPYVS
jgi:tyrosine-protein kinase